jgi:hypothetical protein
MGQSAPSCRPFTAIACRTHHRNVRLFQSVFQEGGSAIVVAVIAKNDSLRGVRCFQRPLQDTSMVALLL